MEFKAKTQTEQILTVMYILAWVAFVGMILEGLGVLSYYGVTTIVPGWVNNEDSLPYQLRTHNVWHYTLRVSFVLLRIILNAYAAWFAIQVIEKVKIQNPFQFDVAQLIEKISYYLFASWIAAMWQNGHTLWIRMNTNLSPDWVSGEFIFAAAVVYVIAQIFKRGVELQSESDLTV